MTASLAPPAPEIRADRGERLALLAFLLPGLLATTFIVAIPLAGVVLSSLTGAEGLTLANYIAFFSDRYYVDVLLNTAGTGAQAALIALVLGYPIALYLRFSPDAARRYIALIVVSPLLISVVVRTFALILLIGPQNPLQRLLGDVFPDVRFNLMFTRSAVMIGLVYTLTPYMVLSLVSNMATIDGRMLTAARSLGASSWTVFRRIVLPLTVPGILTGCFAVFALSVTSFVLPIMLGGSGYKMIAQSISEQLLLTYNWPVGYTISIILLVFNGALLVGSALLVRRVARSITGGAA